jgi:hypothetical protein
MNLSHQGLDRPSSLLIVDGKGFGEEEMEAFGCKGVVVVVPAIVQESEHASDDFGNLARGVILTHEQVRQATIPSVL